MRFAFLLLMLWALACGSRSGELPPFDRDGGSDGGEGGDGGGGSGGSP